MEKVQQLEKYYLKLNDALKKLKCSEKILITTHINPDGDALGSSIAIYFYLLEYNKKPQIIIDNDVPNNLRFLEGSTNILKYENFKNKFNKYDLIILLDLNQSSRLGNLEDFVVNSKTPKIIIDHHKFPQIKADICISQDNASSTGEIIWDLIGLDKHYNVSKNVASALYTAIMTDTGSFRFSSTTPKVFDIAGKLVALGANPASIYDYYYNTNTIVKMKLYGLALSSIETYHNNELCLMTLTKNDFIKTGANEDDVENFVENLLTIQDVKIGILLMESLGRNEIRLSFRSKDAYEVRELAVQFGGGGHAQAAGARVKNSKLNDVKKEILIKAEKLFKK